MSTAYGERSAAAGLPTDLHAQRLLLLAGAGRLSRVVHVLVELGIAERIGDETRTVDELAADTGTDALSLYRILRVAASVGIFQEGPAKAFSATPLSDGLRPGHPGSVLPLVQYNNLDLTRRPFEQILHSVRTGAPAFDEVFGRPFYAYLESHPEAGEFFERFMLHWSRRLVAEELPKLGLERFRRIVDLGGGDGGFLAEVLRRQPGTTGVLMDLPRVAASARARLAEAGLADRVTVVPDDFFRAPIPTDGDAYLLKGVLHNWSDDKVRELLHRLRAAIGPREATLLVFDVVMSPDNRWDHGKFLDADMLVLFGGRERTLPEWRKLFAETGFELTNEPEYRWAMLECRPV
uniref:C3 O-methyltransferase n=1 Tax=Streptomyces olivaceus TaxID=47716 RepID=A8KQY8_STROV|nr:C3 O-methyltransferase [Streptomyces olivaceus]